MALTSKKLFMTVLMILLNTGWMIVTGVTYKIINDWKSSLEIFIKKTMRENLKYFIFNKFIRRLDQTLDILSIGLIIGAIILAILIFRGGMEIFKKVNEKAEKEEVSLNTQTSGGCFFDIELGEATVMPGGA